MTLDADLIKRSVTQADHQADAPVYVFAWTAARQRVQADLPAWWTHDRDAVLRTTLTMDPLWAGAVVKATTKIAALGWNLTDSTQLAERKKRQAQDMLHASDGAGWVSFIARVLQDFLLTDNGAFVEIVRATNGAGSRILGLMHLDSERCTRTGNAHAPVLFRDLLGQEHVLRDYQVMTFVDLPSPSESYHGVGLSAASRCYVSISRQHAMNTYLLEKMTGDGATELAFIQGLSQQTFESAIVTSDSAQQRRGATYYKGKIVVPIMTDVPLSVQSIPLKSVPDGFNPVELRQQAAQDYANNLGIPVQDVIPLSGQGLGTGTQTLILAEDADGQGLAAFRRQWVHMLNTCVLPRSTTFAWSNANDVRDQKSKADAQLQQVSVLKAMVEAQIIDAQIARQIAVDLDLVPRQFLPDDQTPEGGVLSDDEQPQVADAEASSPTAPPAVPPLPPPRMQPTVKARKKRDDDEEIAALLETELDAARALARKARKEKETDDA